jgi:hypothetical protein
MDVPYRTWSETLASAVDLRDFQNRMGLLGFRLMAAVSVHEPSKLMYRHNKNLQTASCDNQDVFPVSVRETKLFYWLKNIPRFSAKMGGLSYPGLLSRMARSRSVRQTYWLLYEQR